MPTRVVKGGVALSPRIPTENILDDIRAGLGDVPIMEKYQISPGELLRIKRRFDRGRQAGEQAVTSAAALAARERRSLPRQEPLLTVTVCDADEPLMQGIIHDINMKGLKVVGIIVRADETRTLMIRSEPFNVHATFTFQARCHWSMIDEYGECVAGFRITHISQRDAGELRKLMACLAVQTGGR